MPLAPDANSPADLVFSLAGNPNVGKSTVFNGLTGLHQHTGNWPGKTVSITCGRCGCDLRGAGDEEFLLPAGFEGRPC